MNGTTVLDGDAYLIPWKVNDENKLYHWNEDGGETTWTLTDSMKGKQNLHLYKLTDQGRADQGAVSIVNNQVTLTAEPKTAYVLAEAKDLQAPDFGTDTPFKDPGFNAADTLKKNWIINAGDPEVVRDSNGDYILQAGKKAMDVSQDLKPMKAGDYSLYVNTETHLRNTTIEIKVDDKSYTKSYDNSIVQNYIQADDNHTSGSYSQYMQKLRIDFTVPKDAKKVTLSLKADADEKMFATDFDVTRFDDLRIVERKTDVSNEKDNVVVSQDFEDTKAIGLYPFAKGQAGGVEDPRIHLAEKNDPYTQYGWNGNKISDALDGNWSLKAHKESAGMMLQTTPQNVTFKPGIKYKVSFDYQTDADAGQFLVGTTDKEFLGGSDAFNNCSWSDQALESTSANGKTKQFSMEVTGAANGETTVGIYTEGGAFDLVIDNFKVVEEGVQEVPVSGLKLGVAGITVIKVGETLDLSPAVVPDNATDKAVTYTFSKDGLVSVDKNGVLKALKAGMVKVTAKAGNQTATATIRVTK